MNPVFTIIKKGILLAVAFLFALNSQAQQLDMKLLKGIEPRNIGPGGMSGRVTALDVVHNNPQIIYAGTASGGLWKSESGGVAWKPVFDSVAVLSIGAVAVCQQNTDIVWAGTGEGNPRNSVTGGYGIYKSLDGGKHWQSMGLEKTRNIHRIIIDKNNSDIVYVGAIGSSWGKHPERGVFKTTDGGKTWKHILKVNSATGAGDLVVDPQNPNKLIAAMWEHERKPWTFTSGGPGSGLYITLDGGDNWKKITDKEGLPKGELGRIGIAIAPSNPNRIYAHIEAKKNALYQSDDGGDSWKKINDQKNIGNRPFYYADIYVDPINENRIYSVFTYINRSIDGGKTFTRWADSYVQNGIHPDHHAFYIHPTNPNFIIDGNDGGLNITRDMGKNWRFAENIPVAQYYHINVDNDFPYNVYGGMQDNGSWVGPAYVLKSGGIRNSYWQEVMFGDGFDAMPDLDDNRYGFAMSQQGYVGRFDRITGLTKMIRPTHPDPDVKLRFNWNSAIAQDPFSHSTIYFGSQFVHKSTDKGDSWEIISPDLTTNDTTKQKQYLSGGITMDATGAENFTTILAIEPSSLEKGLIWASTDDGQIQITRNRGKSWTNLSSRMTGLPKNAWIPQIKASKYKAGEAFVVVNNYRQFDFKPYLFHTTDYGQTWKQMLTQDETFGYSLSMVQDIEEPNLLFLGTEHGLYVSINKGVTWTKWTNGYPSVSTMDLAIQPREHDLVMGTFGRAAWVMDDIRPLRELAKQGAGVLKQTIKVYPAPDAYITANQQASGTRFAGDAIFIGKNRQRGAMITYTVTKPEEKKETPESSSKSKKKKGKKKAKAPIETKKDTTKVAYDTISFMVYNKNNELIRTIKNKYDKNGMFRIYWGMDEKGINYPSREAPKKKEEENGGVSVLPDTYKIVMSFGDQKDSTMINVKFDPRLDIPYSTLEANYKANKQIESQIDVAGSAMTQLRESKKVIDDILKQIKDKGKGYDSLRNMSKATKDSINVLMDELVGPKNEKQGITAEEHPSIMDYYYKNFMYLGSFSNVGPTQTRTMVHAKNKLLPWLSKTNEFFKSEWPSYQKLVDEANLSPFEEIKEFELE
ncbi:MAG: hypothetical protein L3J06_01315 [Cyclobacteriaceae bacterium]|nr:hypothetical protein [Cyclobacteriaceae bacterium]